MQNEKNLLLTLFMEFLETYHLYHFVSLQKCDRAYKHVQSLTAGLSEKEAHDVLNKAVANNSHDQVSLGLLVSILVDPPLAPRVS